MCWYFRFFGTPPCFCRDSKGILKGTAKKPASSKKVLEEWKTFNVEEKYFTWRPTVWKTEYTGRLKTDAKDVFSSRGGESTLYKSRLLEARLVITNFSHWLISRRSCVFLSFTSDKIEVNNNHVTGFLLIVVLARARGLQKQIRMHDCQVPRPKTEYWIYRNLNDVVQSSVITGPTLKCRTNLATVHDSDKTTGVKTTWCYD
jgi:hypothetical protein